MKIGSTTVETADVALKETGREDKKSKSKTEEIAEEIFKGIYIGSAVLVGGLAVWMLGVTLYDQLDKITDSFDRGVRALETASSSLGQLAKEPEKTLDSYDKIKEFCSGLEVFNREPYGENKILYPAKECMKKMLDLPMDVFQQVTAADLPSRVGVVKDYCNNVFHRDLYRKVCDRYSCVEKLVPEVYEQCINSLFGDHELLNKIIS